MQPQINKDLTPDDIAEFLKPLIDISICDQTSLTNFTRKSKEIIAKLNETSHPVILIVNGQRLLLCDVHTYFDLETRRQGLISQLKNVEDAIQIGRIDFANPKIVELNNAQREISELEDEVKRSMWRLKQAKSKLPNAKARLAKLTADLLGN